MVINLQKITADKLISIGVGLGFFLKQFYLAKSGTLQFSDGILMLTALASLLLYGVNIKKRDIPFITFIICTVFINCIYWFLYFDNRFLLSILYMIFNSVLVLFLFRPLLMNSMFLKMIQISFKLVLITQLLVFLTGYGRWYHNYNRYMGTFNDPNQYAFYVLTSFFCIYIIDVIRKERTRIIWIIITVSEILLSASSGMILAFSIFSIGYFTGVNFTSNILSTKRKYFYFTFCFLLAIMIALFYNWLFEFFNDFQILGVSRFVGRINRSLESGGIGYSFFANRGILRVFEVPYFFLFGAGEGGWYRFNTVFLSEGFEIHSTVISLAFYYGIIPFCLLSRWVYHNVNNISFSVSFVYLALFLESLTLINHRQPIFWLLIILASHIALKKQKSKMIDSNV